MGFNWLDKTGKSRVLIALALICLLCAVFFTGIFYVVGSVEKENLILEKEQLLNELNATNYTWLLDTSLKSDYMIVYNYSCMDNTSYSLRLDDYGNYTQIIRFGDLNLSANVDYKKRFFGILANPNVVYTNATAGVDFVFGNRTESSSLGARLSAPVLFMDFNKNESGATPLGYVQDNSLYNNFGLLGNATAGTQPIWTSTAGYDSSGSYQFDGANDYIDIPNKVTGLGAKSFSFWAKSNSSTSSMVLLSNAEGAGTNAGNYLRWNAGGTVGSVGWGLLQSGTDCFNVFASVANLNDGNWRHFVWTWDGTTNLNGIKLYVNGVLGLNTTASVVETELPTRNLKIGIFGDNTGAFFNGTIDQVQIWNRALSASEVLNLYNGTINNSQYIGKYANSGNFNSLVFYNSTSNYWNTTFSLADTYSSRTGIVNNKNEINLSNPNLVSYWKLDGSYADAKGTNNGTCSGTSCPNNATGLSSSAMRFDGVDDYVNLTSSQNINFSGGAQALSSWIKTNSVGTTYIIAKRTAALPFWELRLSAGKIQYTLGQNTTKYTIFNTTRNYNDNNWHNIIAVYNGSNGANIYVDGVNDTVINIQVGTIGNYDNNQYISIGSDGTGASIFNGTIDEVLIYNKSLSQAEITSLYKSGLSQHATTNVTLQYRTASSYNTSDSGLVSLWGLNNDSTIGENSTLFVDSANRNNGTCSGTACPSYNLNGTVGGAYSFDGVDDTINMTTTSSLTFGNAETISVWINDKSPSVLQLIVDKEGGLKTSIYLAIADSYANTPEFWIFNGTWQGIKASNTISANQWYHIAVTYNGSLTIMYVNGVLSNSSTSLLNGALPNATNPVYIGSRGSASGFFNGTIDEVRIYNRSLSASEVLDLYNLGSSHINWDAPSFASEQTCYDNETQILTLNENGKEEWKYFKDLNKNEKVATLNPKTQEIEYNLPSEYQTYDAPEFMYKIKTEKGELVISPEHKVYASDLVKPNTSLVLNTGIGDCFLNSLSFDHIGKSNFKANAKKSISSRNSCLSFSEKDLESFSARLKNSEYSPSEMKSTDKASSLFNTENSLEDNLVLDKINDSYLLISFNESSGETNLCFINSSLVGESCQKKLNKILVSATNNIYSSPLFLSSSNLPFLASLPNLTDQSVNPDSSSCLSLANIFCLQANCLALDSMQDLTNPDQLTSGNCFISLLTSSGTDNVIDTILTSNLVDYLQKRKYVEVFKPIDLKDFSLQQIKDVYSDYESEKDIYFLDSENNPIKILNITKDYSYSGKIYDVTVKNHIILVKGKDSSAMWSGNCLDGVPVTSSTSGKFMQFRANFYTNDTSISPYFLNHSVSGIPTLNSVCSQLNRSGFFNLTYSDTCGIGLDRNSTSFNATQGDFKPLVYFNTSQVYWNTTLALREYNFVAGIQSSLSNGRNITLYTRTATSYNTSDTGLVSIWGLNNDSSIGENSTKFVDSAGRNNGVCSGTACPTYSLNGTVGSAYSFDGVDDYVNVTNINSLKNINGSYSVWFNTNDVNSNNKYLLSQIGGVWIFFSANQIACQSANSSATYSYYRATINRNLSANTWYNVVCNLRSDNYPIVYINGVQEAVTNLTTTYTVTNTNLTIGAYQTLAAGTFFNGTIDEVRIYNRSLSAAEISDLYNIGSYHITWDNGGWQNEGIVNDSTAKSSSYSGKFFQFKALFDSNDTMISPYIMNYSAGSGGIGNPPNITIIYPVNNSYYNSGALTLNFSITGIRPISSCWYYNGSINSTPDPNCNNISGINIGEGRYTWILYANDTGAMTGSSNVSFIIDLTKPAVELNAPANNSINLPKNLTFNFTAYDNYASTLNCSLYIDNVLNITNTSVSNNTLTNLAVNLISEGIHYWNVSCRDYANNINFSSYRNFVVNVSPVLNNITSSNIVIKGGEVITISPNGTADPQNDTLYYYCSSNSAPTSSNTNCSQGNSQYVNPYSSMTCSFASAVDNINHTIYCRTYDGTYYSNISNITYTSDSTPPVTSVISVAGDTSPTYYDNVNDGITPINVSGEQNMSCRLYDSDTAYNAGLGTACSINGIYGLCSATTLVQGLDVANYYVSCADNYSNGQNTSQNLDIVSLVIDWTAPSTSDNATNNIHLQNYAVNISEIDNLDYGAGGILTYYCNDTNNLCNPETSIDDKETITFSQRGLNYLRYYSVDSAGNIQANQSKNISINQLPVFTSASDDSSIIKGGNRVTVTTVSYDNDTSQNLSLFVCNSTNVNSSGCISSNLCSNTTSSLNPSCSFSSETDNSVHNWYAFIYDSLNESAISNSSGSYTSDSQGPNITIIEPLQQNYTSSDVEAILFLAENADKAWFCLDNCISNTSMNQGALPTYWTYTMENLSNADHSVIFYANDTYGNIFASNSRSFTVNTALNDTTPPSIIVWTPSSNTYYTNTSITLRITTNEDTIAGYYSLDNSLNVSMVNSSSREWNKTISLAEGYHNITFYANDTAVTTNIGNSSLVEFYIDITPPIINSTNNTPLSPNENNNVSCYAYVYDNVRLSHGIIRYNSTGTFVNSSNISLSSNNDLLNYTIDAVNVSAGTFNCTAYVFDKAGFSNSSSWLIQVSDVTNPSVKDISYSPSSNDSIDPGSVIIVTANITDNVGVASAYLEYKNSTISWTQKSMSISSGNIYSANFTAYEGNWSFRINASDSEGNSNISVEYNISSFYDSSWKNISSLDLTKVITQDQRGIISLGQFIINSTGDLSLSFNISSIKDWIKFNATGSLPVYTLVQGENILFNVTANVTSFPVGTYAYNISLVSNSTDLANYTISGTVVIQSIAGAYPTPSITVYDPNVNKGDTITLTATVTNLGTDDGNGIWLAWVLPSNFSLESGTLNKSVGFLGVGSSSSNSITAAISSSAADGYYTVYAVSGYSSSLYNDSKAILVGQANITTSTTVVTTTTGNTGGAGGGGGAPSGSSGSSYVEKLLQTSSIYELVRGYDNNFTVVVENPFDGILNDVQVKISGFLSQYLKVSPEEIDGIDINSSKNFTVSILAPKYFNKGSYDLNFTITGLIEKNGSEGNNTWTSIKKMKDSRLIRLEIHEVSRKSAIEYLDNISLIIDSMSKFNVDPLLKLYNQANESFSERDYENVKLIYDQALKSQADALSASALLDELQKMINVSLNNGIKLPKTERLILLAEAALDRGDYETANARANDAKVTYALESIGKINIVRFIINHWYQLCIAAVGVSALSYLALLLIQYQIISGRLVSLRKEEEILFGLIKEVQRECFEKGTMNINEYMDSLLQYEKRISKVIQSIITLETRKINTFRMFKPESKRLVEERNKLLDLIKKTQELYLGSGKIETRVYENRMKSYTERFAEIEEKLADFEAKKELKKVNRFSHFSIVKNIPIKALFKRIGIVSAVILIISLFGSAVYFSSLIYIASKETGIEKTNIMGFVVKNIQYSEKISEYKEFLYQNKAYFLWMSGIVLLALLILLIIRHIRNKDPNRLLVRFNEYAVKAEESIKNKNLKQAKKSYKKVIRLYDNIVASKKISNKQMIYSKVKDLYDLIKKEMIASDKDRKKLPKPNIKKMAALSIIILFVVLIIFSINNSDLFFDNDSSLKGISGFVVNPIKNSNSSVSDDALVIYSMINNSEKDMDIMLKDGFSIIRYNDTLGIVKQAFEAQLALEKAGGHPDYSAVKEDIDELKKIKDNAYEAVDQLKAAEAAVNLTQGIDTQPVKELFSQAKESFASERYEESIKLVEDTYNKISEMEAFDTKLKLFYEITSRNLMGFLKNRWKIILSSIIILAMIIIFSYNSIGIYLIMNKIKNMELRKESIQKLIAKTQKEYFESGSLSESTYKTRTTKYAELIRDINRQIPLLKEELEIKKLKIKKRGGNDEDKRK